MPKIQRYIIRSIYAELLNSGKEVLTVTRNERTFTILPLYKEGKINGLIHLMIDKNVRDDNVDCTVVR